LALRPGSAGADIAGLKLAQHGWHWHVWTEALQQASRSELREAMTLRAVKPDHSRRHFTEMVTTFAYHVMLLPFAALLGGASATKCPGIVYERRLPLGGLMHQHWQCRRASEDVFPRRPYRVTGVDIVLKTFGLPAPAVDNYEFG
jgi:hypothetical protein